MKSEKLFILFFIKKSRLLKNGQATIKMRVSCSNNSAEIVIGRSIPVKLWSQIQCRSLGKDETSEEINSYIDTIRVKIRDIYRDLDRKGEIVTARQICDIYLGKDRVNRTIYSVFAEHNNRCRELIGIDYVPRTVSKFDYCLRNLMLCIKQKYNKDDLPLDQVNGTLIRNFELYLKTEKGCAQNTVIRYMKSFKKIIIIALSNNWIKKDPFYGIKFRAAPTHPIFLTQDEIKRIVNKKTSVRRIDVVRDIFIFCCFTGLGFTDVSNLKAEHIQTDNDGKLWIRIPRSKTKNMCNIPLLDIPIKIIEKYKNDAKCREKDQLLPVYSNQKMNVYLQEIASICGINKHITTHVARHTFASIIALGNDVSLPNVAQMLGHSSTKMTEHYAKVLDSSIMRDMEHVEKVLAEHFGEPAPFKLEEV